MVSLTNRINNIKQPKGGFLPLDSFNTRVFFDKFDSIIPVDYTPQPQLKGLMVDYLIRVHLGFNKRDAFKISLFGADLLDDTGLANIALSFINTQDVSDLVSLSSAYHLVKYDVAYRRGVQYYKPSVRSGMGVSDWREVSHMVIRALNFFEKESQNIIDVGVTFDGLYSDLVTSADVDYISQNTLWDLKTSKDEPNIKDTLQILGYYLMGLMSGDERFKKIDTIGIYNPRLNKSYTLPISEVGVDCALLAGVALFGNNFMTLSIQNLILNRFSEVRSENIDEKMKEGI